LLLLLLPSLLPLPLLLLMLLLLLLLFRRDIAHHLLRQLVLGAAVPAAAAAAAPAAQLGEALRARRRQSVHEPAVRAEQREPVARQRLVLAQQHVEQPVVPVRSTGRRRRRRPAASTTTTATDHDAAATTTTNLWCLRVPRRLQVPALLLLLERVRRELGRADAGRVRLVR
jgi:hypothetical protein